MMLQQAMTVWRPRRHRKEIPRPRNIFPDEKIPITEADLEEVSPLERFARSAKELCENQTRSKAEKLIIASDLSTFFYKSVLLEASKPSINPLVVRGCKQDFKKLHDCFHGHLIKSIRAKNAIKPAVQQYIGSLQIYSPSRPTDHSSKKPDNVSVNRWLESVLRDLNSCFPGLLPPHFQFKPAPYRCYCEQQKGNKDPCICSTQRLRFTGVMTEPQPANVEEGDQVQLSAEDRKAAAALSRLDQRGSGEDDEGAKQVDNKKLGEAMKSIGSETTAKTPSGPKPAERQRYKPVKADVDFMMQQFDLNRTKATDYLQKYDGYLEASMAYIHGESRY